MISIGFLHKNPENFVVFPVFSHTTVNFQAETGSLKTGCTAKRTKVKRSAFYPGIDIRAAEVIDGPEASQGGAPQNLTLFAENQNICIWPGSSNFLKQLIERLGRQRIVLQRIIQINECIPSSPG